jgi:type IX secretion system PorP/SprF family membrane protein
MNKIKIEDMKKIFLLTGLLILCGVFKTEAQQVPQFSQYMFNGIYINPAYAGYKDIFYGHMVYRKQWVGISGTPQTTMLSVDGSLSKGSSVGFIYTNDQIGETYTNSFMLDYAYRIQVSESGRLSFGLSAGMTHHGFDRSKFADEDGEIDPEALNAKNVWKPGFDVGLYFDTKNFYAGFSIMGLVASKADREAFQVIRADANYFLTLGGILPLNNSLKLLPSTLLKSDFKNPLTFDINALLMINDRVAVGGSYRTGVLWFSDAVEENTVQKDAISVIAEVYVTEKIRLGMAYDFSLNKVMSGANGSFEVSLGYYFVKPKKQYVTPRYF